MNQPPPAPGRNRVAAYAALLFAAVVAGLAYFGLASPQTIPAPVPDSANRTAPPAAKSAPAIKPAAASGVRIESPVAPPVPPAAQIAQVANKPSAEPDPYADPELEKKISLAKTFVNSEINTPLLTYRMHTGSYPDADEGLQALVVQPAGVAGWRGPYITGSSAPLDPWGHPYHYAFPGTHGNRPFDVWSLGPSGKEDASDLIGNWEK